MTRITEEEAKFAPVSLLDELESGEWSTPWLQEAISQCCANCLWPNWCGWSAEHCVGEKTDFDA